MYNGGTYACRNIAGSSTLSVHAAGRAWDDMTGTGAPTRESRFLVEQMRVFSLQMGIQGIIHAGAKWFCNLGPSWTVYTGTNPHMNHAHIEIVPNLNFTPDIVRRLFQGPAPTGSKLTAGAVVKEGSTGGAVEHVQRRLYSHGFSLSADGVCGPKTTAAIVTFQKLCGIGVDGIAGAVTQGRLQ